MVVIKGVEALENYLREVGCPMSRPTIMKYIANGLPCWYAFGAYHFHPDNINEYFKMMTAKPTKEVPEETLSSKESVKNK